MQFFSFSSASEVKAIFYISSQSPSMCLGNNTSPHIVIVVVLAYHCEIYKKTLFRLEAII